MDSNFKKLQSKWYAKLKKEGFKDLESEFSDVLKNNSTSGGSLDKRRWHRYESNKEYYQLATYFLNDYKFKNRTEQIIWEYHTNGISIRDIAQILNKIRKKKIQRMAIWHIVRKLEQEMKKMYMVVK